MFGTNDGGKACYMDEGTRKLVSIAILNECNTIFRNSSMIQNLDRINALLVKKNRSYNELNNIMWSLDSRVVDAVRIAICFENFFKVKLLLDGYVIHHVDRKIDKLLASRQYKFPIKVCEIGGNIFTVLTTKTIGWSVLMEDKYKQQLSMPSRLFDALDSIVESRNNLHYLIANDNILSVSSLEDLFYIRTCYKEFITKLYKDLLMEYEVYRPENNSHQSAWVSCVKLVKALAAIWSKCTRVF